MRPGECKSDDIERAVFRLGPTVRKLHVDLAGELGGALLTFDGTQHTVVFEGDACVDSYAAKYLVDLTLPPQGANC